jgi:4,4'-diaponeurosporenoate glycosyltransferase
LPSLLHSIKKQSHSDYEVIVSDDQSTDATQAIARRYGCRVMINDKIGEYPSRNLAARQASGDIILFTGADVMFPSYLLSYVAMQFSKDNKLAGLYIPTFPYDGKLFSKLEFPLWYIFTSFWYYATHEGNPSTSCFALRNSVFRSSDGFRSEAFDDSGLARRLGKMGYKIKPFIDTRVAVSGRRTHQGIAAFNRYHMALMVEAVMPPLRSREWVVNEKRRVMGVHTRSGALPQSAT